MYIGRRVARVRSGAIPPNLKAEWLVADLVKGIKHKYEVRNSNRTKLVNWWRFGLEIYLG